MGNPINNLIQPITSRDLRVCKRCGCDRLAWVQFKSGKWSLVRTATKRPYWQGDSPAPEGLWAMKTAYHDCAEYRAHLTEMKAMHEEMTTGVAAPSKPHPSTVDDGNALEILSAVMLHIYKADPNGCKDVTGPTYAAFTLLGKCVADCAPKP